MSEQDEFSTQFAIRLPDGEMYLSPQSGAVVTWSQREGAEYVLEQPRLHALAMGIRGWVGTIMHRYCTPFIGDSDQAAAAKLVDELTAWLQGGAK